MNIGDEDVTSGFATLLPGAEEDDDDAGEVEELASQLSLGLPQLHVWND